MATFLKKTQRQPIVKFCINFSYSKLILVVKLLICLWFIDLTVSIGWIYHIIIRSKRGTMAKVVKQKVDQLIRQMNHYDPDNMEMGAKRLTELILQGAINLDEDPKIANLIRQAFMKQIESQNDTVQSEAIKYLAEIVPKLPSEQVEIIYEKILEHITNLNEAEKKRERYGACAATVIHQAAEQFGKKLQNLFLKSVRKLLQFKDKKEGLQFILINIITEFIKKWPNISLHLTYDKKSLVIYLLKNIEVKSKLDIIKKSEACLGKLALILDRQLINVTLNDNEWGLLKFISKNATSTSLDNLKLTRNGLLCLSQIIKTHNYEIRFWVRQIAALLVSIINHFKGYEDIDNIQIVCDILDAALTALSYTLKTFSRELKDQLKERKNKFNNFLKELLFFNVEGMMSEAGEQMEVEEYEQDEEYYEQTEVDQKCWKVRRSALFYISFLAKYDKGFLQSMKEGQIIEDLGSKLVQQHSMVSEMAFFTFNQLIQLISIDRSLTNDQVAIEEISLQRVKSSALEIADHIIKQVTKRIGVILNNSKFNDQLKIESSKILLRLVQIYNHILISNQQETFSLIDFVLLQLKRTNINQNKANLLLSLKELISQEHSFEKYQVIYDYFFETINKNNNAKIQSICLLGIKKIIQIFRKNISSHPQNKEKLINLLKNKIKELDSDKLVKTALCKSLAIIFQYYQISDEDLEYFLNYFAQKLKIQVEKVYLIECLSKLNKETKLNKNSSKALEGVVKQIAENIGSNNYELNFKSIQTIHHLLGVLRQGVNQKLLEQLLEKSKIMLGQGKIPLFFSHIAQSNPKLLKPYAELIVKSTESNYIFVLIKEKLIDINSCLKILKGLDQEKSKKISQTLGAIRLQQSFITKQIDQSAWGRILLGALGYVGNEKTIPLLYKYISEFKSDEAKVDAFSAIGNIISRNPDVLVPQLVQKANAATDIYIYLYILKEMLNYNKNPFGYLIKLIQWLFVKAESDFEAQSNYYITSECVGKLAFLNPSAAKKAIQNTQSKVQNRRLIAASSLRFGLENKQSLPEEILEEYVSAIVNLCSDQRVRVRQGAVKSLISVGQTYLKGLKHHEKDSNFWKSIISNSRINDSLIITIDYGICKQIRDDGKNLRLQSFNLLQFLVKKLPLEEAIIKQLLQVSLHRIMQQSSNDIALKRLSVIKHLCEIDFTLFLRYQAEFLAKVNPKDGLLKRYEKGNQDERTQIYLKGLLKQIYEINTLAKEQKVEGLQTLMIELRNHPIYSKFLQQLDRIVK